MMVTLLLYQFPAERKAISHIPRAQDKRKSNKFIALSKRVNNKGNIKPTKM